ncbi:LLM class flavin-dependent oxidoreductase [Acetobacter sp. TBRC 12305]|uniref:LLM class flavin-dependent oxidoreductase n=1 Tax=Acetobacter garciniae TaxID=2817435 RepID=A0A939KMQ9_9PROT|nr:LLM class flavin-dependent oxidoreductase [Acetobacter garciniae]MBO1325583.1 LLM class flavin-dependent oxidoreductase [Acetobacter garciniae]MBX0345244.1 LLM class flavin-dependent oxidoreductase [Acetobacter garciniae]
MSIARDKNGEKRKLVLGAFLTRYGHHPGAWRQPESVTGGGPNFDYWLRLVQTAERGKFDTVFLADFVGANGAELSGYEKGHGFHGFEPLSLISALAVATRDIGLVATVNTNFTHPYTLARTIASIDHLSRGRVGWNVVSSLSPGSIKTFGVKEPLDHAARYVRATEFIEVAKKLWDSWDDDAFDHADKASGRFLDPAQGYPVHHHGRYYDVDALLDLPRPIQGYPVFVQAGSSDTGRDFAARHAEMIYVAAQFFDDAKEYYDDVKSRMAQWGRTPDQMKITPGLSFSIGRTAEEAQEKFEKLQEAVNFSGPVELMGVDLTGYPLDGPLPADIPVPENGRGRWQQVVRLAEREKLSIRQLVLRYNVVRGHRVVIGTPSQVADQIEDWFVRGVVDGFNLISPLNPSFLEEFVDLVVPELQRRGLFRTEYEGSTLRERLRLPRPANQHDHVLAHKPQAVPA